MGRQKAWMGGNVQGGVKLWKKDGNSILSSSMPQLPSPTLFGISRCAAAW